MIDRVGKGREAVKRHVRQAPDEEGGHGRPLSDADFLIVPGDVDSQLKVVGEQPLATESTVEMKAGTRDGRTAWTLSRYRREHSEQRRSESVDDDERAALHSLKSRTASWRSGAHGPPTTCSPARPAPARQSPRPMHRVCPSQSFPFRRPTSRPVEFISPSLFFITDSSHCPPSPPQWLLPCASVRLLCAPPSLRLCVPRSPMACASTRARPA